MIKFIGLLILACLACHALFGKWPWQYFMQPSASQQSVDRARRLLGLSADATRQEINEAHRRVVALVHPDRGGTNAQVHEANDARDVLLNHLPKED